MNVLRTDKNTHKWVLFVLLTFLGQMVAADVHSNMVLTNTPTNSASEADVSPTCHGDMDHRAETVVHAAEVTFSAADTTCCEGDCSMATCHAVSVILTSVRFITFEFRHHSPTFFGQVAVAKLASSLYRPPILG